MTSHSWGFTLRRPPARRPRAVLAAGLAATAVLVAACASTAAAGHAPGAPATGAGMAGQPMPGMAGDIPRQGLLATAAGLTLRPLTGPVPAGRARGYWFQTIQSGGCPQTPYPTRHTPHLHFYRPPHD